MDTSLHIAVAISRHADLAAEADRHRLVSAARTELRAVRAARRAERLHERAVRLAARPVTARV